MTGVSTNEGTREIYYSQHGEDFLLEKLFEKEENNGYYVEVGCIDGKVFSNSLFFEENGWNGMCVEAHPDYIELLNTNRPNSIVVHAAAGERDEAFVEFYANLRGSLSTLEKGKEKEFAQEFGKWFTGFEVKQVPMYTLDTIYAQYDIDKIDFLSLDIEGYEVCALKGMSFKKYKPTVIIVESDSKQQRMAIESILLPIGYHFITSIGMNIIYSLDKSHKEIISNKRFTNIHLRHFKHPVDSGDNKDRVVTVSTNRTKRTLQFFKQRLRKFISLLRSIIIRLLAGLPVL